MTSFDFTLWSVSGNTVTSYSTLSLSAPGPLSFSIGAAGYYFLTVNLQIASIDSTTRYPIALNFTYAKGVCASGQFYNKVTKACVACSTDPNSPGSSK